jgi:phosphate uptake regulator
MDKKQAVTTEYTFDSVWKTLDRLAAEAVERHKETERVIRELSEQMKENERTLAELHKETEKAFKGVAEAHEETEKAIKNQSENIDRRSAERDKEWERSREEIERVMKNLSENIGGVNNSIGKLVETLIAARLWEKFAGYGLQRAHRRVTVHGDDHRPRAEIDIVLTNTDCAIAVEVKRELDKTEDVDRHLERMELIRQYPPAVIKENSKRVMGAVAGGTVDPDVMEYAHKHGLFVLELSGESVRLAPAPAGFTPRVWKSGTGADKH